MSVRKRKSGAMVLIIIAALILGASGAVYAQTAPISLRYAHCQKTGHPYDLGAQKFAELVAQKTGGKVKVQVFPNSVLGNGTQAVDSTRMGTIDFVCENSALYEGYVKDVGVLGVLHLFTSWDQFWKVIDGDIGKKFDKQLEPVGFKVLGWMRNGWYHLCTRTKVEKPSELKGLKFRAKPGSAAALIQDTAYGTVSTSVDYSELYSGFQLGVVNGMLQNVTNLRDTTLYEVTPYILTIGAQYATNPLIVSMKTFKKLSPDIQQALIEAGQEACAYERKVSEEFEVKDLVFLKSDPKVFVSAPSPENQKLWDALWSEKIEGMANKYYGKDLVQQIRNTK